MSDQPVARDERTIAVENESYRLAYLLLSFGLLASVAYRGLMKQESNWDLLGLVLLGGLATSLYQGIHKVLTRQWALVAVVTLLVAAGIGLAISLVRW